MYGCFRCAALAVALASAAGGCSQTHDRLLLAGVAAKDLPAARHALAARRQAEGSFDAHRWTFWHAGVDQHAKQTWGHATQQQKAAEDAFRDGDFAKAAELWHAAAVQYAYARMLAANPLTEPVGRHFGILDKRIAPEPEYVTIHKGVLLIEDFPEFGHVVSAGRVVPSPTAATPGQYRTSRIRIPGDTARDALLKYRALYWQPVVDSKAGRKYWRTRTKEMRATFRKAVDAYAPGPDKPLGPEKFVAFLRADPARAAVLAELGRLAEVLRAVEAIGAPPVEQARAVRMLIRPVTPKPLTTEQFLAIVNTRRPKAPAPATPKGPATRPTSRPAGEAGKPVVALWPSPPGPAPADASGARDGPTFRIGAVSLSYGRGHPGHPKLDALMEVEIELGTTPGGYVVPREGVPSVRLRLKDVPGLSERTFHATAIRAIAGQIAAWFRARGFAGVFVAPHREDIDCRTARDLRKAGSEDLRIVVWTTRLVEVRTVAFSRKVPIGDRVSSPPLAGIVEGCPLRPGDLLRMDRALEYAAHLSRAGGRHVNLALSPGPEEGQAVLDFLVLGGNFRIPAGE